MELISWIYQGAVLLVLLSLFATLIINLFVIPVLKEEQPPDHEPLISILIPARNEEERIGNCLISLLRQNYRHLEIIVLDDQSEDSTADLVREVTGEKLRLVTGKPLPGGWTGKSWACHQLAAEARGGLLLFTDADTVHSPGTISAVVRQQQGTDADLLTVWPYQITGSWAEKLVIPLLYVVAASFLPHWFLGWCQKSRWLAHRIPRGWLRALGTANGQFLLFRREAYFLIGGHAGVRDHMVEDVALGREIAARTGEGLKLTSCDGTRLMQCRMYRSLPEIWEGFTKNLRSVYEGKMTGFLLGIVCQAAVMILPCIVVWFSPSPILLAEVTLIYLIRTVATLRFSTSWIGLVLHPIGYSLSLAIALNSLIKTRGSGVKWKGRVYLGSGDKR